MSNTAVRTNEVAADARAGKVDMKLEVVVIPVSDVDRAKKFYGSLGYISARDDPRNKNL